jgi:hypothetical protein
VWPHTFQVEKRPKKNCGECNEKGQKLSSLGIIREFKHSLQDATTFLSAQQIEK